MRPVLPALVLIAMATAALAEPVKLTDDQLDLVTAGVLGTVATQIAAATESAAGILADKLPQPDSAAGPSSNSTLSGATITAIGVLSKYGRGDRPESNLLRSAIQDEHHYSQFVVGAADLFRRSDLQ